MKMKLPILLALLALPASAVVNIDYVTVGNAGNAADAATGSIYGAVSYAYNIGKYEVTNAQYAEFLNAADPTGVNPNGIYNSSMGFNGRGGIAFNSGAASGSKYLIKSNMGDKPVNYVSWYDAARFTNWINNGQGAGSTETGAYTLSGNTGIITKNVGATVWLPSEDEWYKAAYYDPSPGAGGGDYYWLYPTQSNTAPTVATANATGDISNPGVNVANYDSGANWNSISGNLTTVGSAGANNFYGTFDQGGNLGEWNDAIIGSSRGMLGGSIFGSDGSLASWARFDGVNPSVDLEFVGFRVAGAIPEPTIALLSILGLFPLLSRRRKA